MISPITKGTLVLLSLTLMLSFYLSITTEHGFLDLHQLKKEKESLIIKNSIIGQEILGQINIFKRLAKNDLKLIEHIARSELRMVAKNELILIPKDSQESSNIEKQNGEKPDNFRILTEDEIDELLSFDINSFKFHDKLKDNPG
jgi:cell division protein FtsB